MLFDETLVKEGRHTEIVACHQQMVARMATLTAKRGKAQLEPVTDVHVDFVGEEQGVGLLTSVMKELGLWWPRRSPLINYSSTRRQIKQGYSFRNELLSNRNIVISEWQGNRLQVFDSQGKFIRIVELGRSKSPTI